MCCYLWLVWGAFWEFQKRGEVSILGWKPKHGVKMVGDGNGDMEWSGGGSGGRGFHGTAF